MTAVDTELCEVMWRFECLQLYRGLNLWGDHTLDKIDGVLFDLRMYIMETISFAQTHGHKQDVGLFTAHKQRLSHKRGDCELFFVEHYLLQVINADLEVRTSFTEYKQICYTDTSRDNQTCQQLMSMTFKPLLAYTKKTQQIIADLITDCSRKLQSESDYKKLDALHRIANVCSQMNRMLDRYKIKWIQEQKPAGYARPVISSVPWDFCYSFFKRFHSNVTCKIDALNSRVVTGRMRWGIRSRMRFNYSDNQHAADRLRNILYDLRWAINGF